MRPAWLSLLVPFLLVTVKLAAGQVAGSTEQFPRRLVADYGFWSRFQNPPYGSAQIPFQKLTHLLHAGVGLGAKQDGTLDVPAAFLEPDLVSKGHQAGVKVMLLFGADGAAFSTVAGNPAVRDTLVANLSTFVKDNGYDGIDIDWEFPSAPADSQPFSDLISALRGVLPTPDYLISVDVAPWGGEGYNFGSVVPVVDFLNVMMYDCAGPWTEHGQLNSPVFWDPQNPAPEECQPGGSANDAANIYLNDLQVPAAKLNMGTPFYGYFYRNVSRLFGPCRNCGKTVLSENYGTFIKRHLRQRKWRAFRDAVSLVPYMLRADGRPGFITYDDPSSTFARVSYSLWTRGLGGTFMWSLDADYDGHSQDLLDAMYSATLQPPQP